jgi:hypothetical protein
MIRAGRLGHDCGGWARTAIVLSSWRFVRDQRRPSGSVASASWTAVITAATPDSRTWASTAAQSNRPYSNTPAPDTIGYRHHSHDISRRPAALCSMTSNLRAAPPPPKNRPHDCGNHVARPVAPRQPWPRTHRSQTHHADAAGTGPGQRRRPAPADDRPPTRAVLRAARPPGLSPKTSASTVPSSDRSTVAVLKEVCTGSRSNSSQLPYGGREVHRQRCPVAR